LTELQQALLECAPAWFRKDESLDPDWRWAQDEDVRADMRPLVADKAETAQFLASRGIVLTPEARDRFLDAVDGEFGAALKLLVRRANRDYTPDTRAKRFPKFAQAPQLSHSGPLCFELFEAWIRAVNPGNSTIDRWRAVFLDLQSHFADRTAG